MIIAAMKTSPEPKEQPKLPEKITAYKDQWQLDVPLSLAEKKINEIIDYMKAKGL